MTVVNQAGEAVAHACARGRHRWTGPPPGPDPPPNPGSAVAALLHELGLTPESFAPIAKSECGHRHAEDHYTPSRKLKHLIGPAPVLHRSRLRRPVLSRRPGPRHPLPGRPHRRVQPARPLPCASPRQASPRLARRSAGTRHHPLDAAQRPHPRRPPNHLRLLTAGLPDVDNPALAQGLEPFLTAEQSRCLA